MSDFINTVDIVDDDALMDSLITRSISEFNDDKITSIRSNAFNSCTNLESVSFPNVTSIGGGAFQGSGLKAITPETFPFVTSIDSNAFNGSALETVDWPNLTNLSTQIFDQCKSLRSVNLPNVSMANGRVFRDCISLTDVNLPLLTDIDDRMFSGCSALETLTLPSLTTMGYWEFPNCSRLRVVDLPSCTSLNDVYLTFGNCNLLDTFILRSKTVCSLSGNGVRPVDSASYWLANTKIARGKGYFYVPKDLIDSYKTTTNWSTYADQFRPLEYYTVDGTTTGAMREHCESLSLNVTELTFTDSNSQTLTISGNFGIFDKTTWKSSDRTVVRVSNGIVTPVGDGTATITAIYGEHSATCQVTVNAGLDSGILYNWDFTTSLVDTISGVEATFPSGHAAIQNSNGLTFSAENQACVLGDVATKNCRIEIDIASTSMSGDVTHHFVRLGSNSLLAWRGSSFWRWYGFRSFNGWTNKYTDNLDVNDMSGATISLEIDSNGYCTLYVDDVLYGNTGSDIVQTNTSLALGSTSTDISTTVITGLRIFPI